MQFFVPPFFYNKSLLFVYLFVCLQLSGDRVGTNVTQAIGQVRGTGDRLVMCHW